MCEVHEVSAWGMLSTSGSAEFFCITLTQDDQLKTAKIILSNICYVVKLFSIVCRPHIGDSSGQKVSIFSKSIDSGL